MIFIFYTRFFCLSRHVNEKHNFLIPAKSLLKNLHDVNIRVHLGNTALGSPSSRKSTMVVFLNYPPIFEGNDELPSANRFRVQTKKSEDQPKLNKESTQQQKYKVIVVALAFLHCLID